MARFFRFLFLPNIKTKCPNIFYICIKRQETKWESGLATVYGKISHMAHALWKFLYPNGDFFFLFFAINIFSHMSIYKTTPQEIRHVITKHVAWSWPWQRKHGLSTAFLSFLWCVGNPKSIVLGLDRRNESPAIIINMWRNRYLSTRFILFSVFSS